MELNYYVFHVSLQFNILLLLRHWAKHTTATTIDEFSSVTIVVHACFSPH